MINQFLLLKFMKLLKVESIGIHSYKEEIIEYEMSRTEMLILFKKMPLFRWAVHVRT